jgi:hydroxymethylpyrimidine/phosphomethylpyrimidine kinase
MIHIALTIAGSDPSGGAGIQADLKTFSALNVYGMAVIAALTAQNTTGVSGVMAVPAEFIAAQLDAVLSDVPPRAVKTGMLGSAAAVETVARKLREYDVQHLVVDPVMVSSSGTLLLERPAIETLKRELLPLAELVTPNLAEASELSGIEVRTTADMEEAARRIQAMGPRTVLVKGGHLDGDAADVFFNGTRALQLRSERVETPDLHGTGCVLSAAITSLLAQGHTLGESVTFAKDFVTASIRRSLRLGKGTGPVNPLAGIVTKPS